MSFAEWNVMPSSYEWLLPPFDMVQLDQLAREGKYYSVRGLVPAVGYCILFGLARVVLAKFVFKPLAISSMNLKVNEVIRDANIDKALGKYKIRKVQQADVKTIAAAAGTDEKQTAQYIWDLKRKHATDQKITKFVEAIWRAVFYLLFCCLAIRALFFPEVASWVKNTEDNWNNWPLQPMNDSVILLYQIQLGSYLHQLMWTEVNRSDAAEMILHHLTTITVVVFSYLTGFTRIGSSIFLVHDIADIFLESAKCFTYVKKAKGREWTGVLADGLFACFAITFFVSRLIVYPRYLVNSLLFEAPRIMGMWPGYYAFAILLLTLQALHIFWFYLICKMIVKLFTTGIEKDVRSDGEDEDISEGNQTVSSNSSASTPAKVEDESPKSSTPLKKRK